MIETNNLFIGRLWTSRYNKDKSGYDMYPVDKKYRIFYLTNHFFGLHYHSAFKEVETNRYFPLDTQEAKREKYLVNTKDAIPLRDAFPMLHFPIKLRKSQVLLICDLYNEMQSRITETENSAKEIETNAANLIRRRVLKNLNNNWYSATIYVIIKGKLFI